jgi:hypothetical protein
MQYQPEDLGPWFDARNAEVTVYHKWDESMVGVKAIDPKTHTLTLASPCGHPPGAFGVQDYVVWNLREGMSQPGQWYLDRTANKVVYRPLPGDRSIAAFSGGLIRYDRSARFRCRDSRLRLLRISLICPRDAIVRIASFSGCSGYPP